MARRDADGYIHLVDRKSNMIISGGENIYPSEVEAVLGAHPAVKDVAVIGVPDAKWGERVHAVVVLHDGATLSEAEMLDWCKDRIAGYKRPRSVSFIAEDEMPRTATGKILHRVLQGRGSTAGKGGAMSERERDGGPQRRPECLRGLDRALPQGARRSTASSACRAATSSRSGTTVARQGIRIVDVRDEGAAVHMAHAHAELTGGFGVAMVTAGPGVTNTVTAIANASLARVPVLLIGGCPPRPQANMGPLQDIPHVDILRPVTRTSRTLRVADQVHARAGRGGGARDGRPGRARAGLSSRSRPTCCARTVPPQLVLDEWMQPEAAARDRARPGRGRGRGRGALVGEAPARHHRPRRAGGAGAELVRLLDATGRALPRHAGEPRPGAGRPPVLRRRRARARR